MTYTPEQLDMLRAHFERCGAPTNRIGLDHWLATQVPDALRESVMAQLFPGLITDRDYAQDLANAGLSVQAVRQSLALLMEPAARERLLAEVFAAKKLYDFPHSRYSLGLSVNGERMARAADEARARARQLEAA